GDNYSSSTELHQASSASTSASASSTPAVPAAAASDCINSFSSASSSSSSSSLLTSGHIAFRLARRTDVPQIINCNLATLPENYNAKVYINYMRTWPELTLVAEHIQEGFSLEDEGDGNRKQRSKKKNNNNNNNSQPRKRKRQQEQIPTEKIGHITSIAVHTHARRLGIASSLLHQLQYHLQECYGANLVGLHVRISNHAAVRLYCEDGYNVADIIPLYYWDGEDAYFMRKDFDSGGVIGGGVSEEVVVPTQPHQQQQQPEERQWRMGQKESNKWLNCDATHGSFFDNRKSMKDALSENGCAWFNSNNGNYQMPSPANNSNNFPTTRGKQRVITAMPNVISPPSSSGQFQHSFRIFFNRGEVQQQLMHQQHQHQQRRNNQLRLPPWETGPEGLRLPRYSKVFRKDEEGVVAYTTTASTAI
ncbi:hypothetical protein ACHAXR_004074, partial [Thalassiosira sp. AJA248-18]